VQNNVKWITKNNIKHSDELSESKCWYKLVTDLFLSAGGWLAFRAMKLSLFATPADRYQLSCVGTQKYSHLLLTSCQELSFWASVCIVSYNLTNFQKLCFRYVHCSNCHFSGLFALAAGPSKISKKNQQDCWSSTVTSQILFQYYSSTVSKQWWHYIYIIY